MKTVIALFDPRLPPVGTVGAHLVGVLRDKVTVLDDGFEYEGRHYTSLSTIAREHLQAEIVIDD